MISRILGSQFDTECFFLTNVIGALGFLEKELVRRQTNINTTTLQFTVEDLHLHAALIVPRNSFPHNIVAGIHKIILCQSVNLHDGIFLKILSDMKLRNLSA